MSAPRDARGGVVTLDTAPARIGDARRPPERRQVRRAPADAPEKWTASAVEERLDEAVDTLKRVPAPDIQRRITRWPEFIRDSREAYGYAEIRIRRAPAAPDAISRMDETLAWLRWLPRDAQRVSWSRANRFSWRRIAYFVGKAPNTCRAWHLAALHLIATRLNRARVPVRMRGQNSA